MARQRSALQNRPESKSVCHPRRGWIDDLAPGPSKGTGMQWGSYTLGWPDVRGGTPCLCAAKPGLL